MTLAEFKKRIDETLEKFPHFADMKVAYSVDDEGNAYHGVHNCCTPAKADDPNDYYLDIEGFWNDEDPEDEDNVPFDEINCIIIN